MAIFKLADRVKETTATTGSGGVYTLDGAPAGWQTFLAACGSGNFTTYAMSDHASWETGIATVTAGTLTRTTLLSSSTGSAINWAAGSKDVWLDLPAARVGEVLLLTATASASSTVDFTGLDSTYIEYLFRFRNVVLATDNVDFNFRVSVASTFLTANYNGVSSVLEAGTPANTASAISADSKVGLARGAGNTSPRHINGYVRLFKPSQTSYPKHFMWDTTLLSSGGTYRRENGFAAYSGANSAVDGVRFLAGSGNITSGDFEMWGVRAS